ncbi:MAG: [FeFe] hydrogenase H-cluster radical SAM maturase HydG, partial [Rikenellaceae bacterium]|nr:[FeFe] hydrogenase H-cluster radical SAM maturase HydG [Rikenellaceae bacterium]
MYNPKSPNAVEFIDDAEILDTLKYAEENCENRALIEDILRKAAEGKGISHREAAVLLDCKLPDLNEKMFKLARQLKQRLYG